MVRALSGLVLVCGLTFFAGLGRPAIADSDEAFYAEAAREMVQSGDWLTPHYNYEYRFQKPVLSYWMIGAAYSAAGVGEAAARVPAAMAGLGLALVTFICGCRWSGSGAGLLAGIIVATSFGYFSMARQSLPDLPLALFVTIATWAGIEAFAGSAGREPHPGRGRGWLLLAAISAAAAVLTKGPVGLALPGIVIVPILLFDAYRDGAGSVIRRMKATDLAIGLAVFFLLAAPWYVAMAQEHGTGYLTNFLIGENLERFATDRFNEPRPIWFYIPIVLAGMLPWSPFALIGLRSLVDLVRRRRGLSLVAVRLLIWAGAPLLFFTLSIGKQPRYVLPVLPPLAILMATAILARIGASIEGRDRRATIELMTAGVLSGAVLLCMAVVIMRAAPLLTVVNAGSTETVAVIIGIAGLTVTAVALLDLRRLPIAVSAAGVVTLLALQYFGLSSSAPEPVQQMAAAVLKHRGQGEHVGAYRVFVRNLVFYTGIRQVDLFNDESAANFLRSNDPILGVIAKDDLARLERHYGLNLRPLDRVRYFNPADLKLRGLLWPDPDRDLHTVLLVTNR